MNANDLHSRSPRSESRPPGPAPLRVRALLTDSCRLGPAPTRAREGAVVVLTALALAVAIAVLQPSAAIASIVVALTVLIMAVRWITGMRSWDRPGQAHR